MDTGSRRRPRDAEEDWGGEPQRQRTEEPAPAQPQPLYQIRTYFEVLTNRSSHSAAPFLPIGYLNTETEYYLKGLFAIPKINTFRNLYEIDRTHNRQDPRQNIPSYFIELQARLIKHLIVITRMRHSFRRLVGLFIKKAIDRQPLSQTDAITLEPIQQPLIVYDIKYRCKYCFEAKPLMIHIHNQLLYSSGGFNSSQMPRNPLTNLPFRLEQLSTIVAQLKKYGHMTWTILAFAQINFSIAKFKILYEPALRYTAIMNYIYVEPPQYIAEELVDFIIVYANIHKYILSTNDINILTYVSAHCPTDPYLMCWRRLYRVALFYNIMSVSDDTPDILLQRKTIFNLSRILLLNVDQYIIECRQKYNLAINRYEQQQIHILEAIMNIYGDPDEDPDEDSSND